jgi:hypothetical protein
VTLLPHFILIASNDVTTFDIATDVDVCGVASGLPSLGFADDAAQQFSHIHFDKTSSIFDGKYFKFAIAFELEQIVVIQRFGVGRFGNWHTFFRIQPLDRPMNLIQLILYHGQGVAAGVFEAVDGDGDFAIFDIGLDQGFCFHQF